MRFGLGRLVLAQFQADYCLVLLLNNLLQIVDFPVQRINLPVETLLHCTQFLSKLLQVLLLIRNLLH